MVETASRPGASQDEAGPIDVELAVSLPATCGCPLQGTCAPTVRRTAAGDPSAKDDCRLVIGTGEDTAFTTAKIGEQCLCPTFDDHDCVWEILEVSTETIHVALTLPERSTLPSLVTELENIGVSVSTERILPTHLDPDDELLTDQQREAFLVALEQGYYERPRRTDLTEIGEALGISKSAASQRLTAARNRIAKQYADDYDIGCIE